MADEYLLEGQVQPFWLDTTDGERLFCWHVLPLDVYLANEVELAQAATSGEVVDGLEGTVGAKLLKRDVESRVVVNFHGVSLFFVCLLCLLIFPCFVFLSSRHSPSCYCHLFPLFYYVLIFSHSPLAVSSCHASNCPIHLNIPPLVLWLYLTPQ